MPCASTAIREATGVVMRRAGQMLCPQDPLGALAPVRRNRPVTAFAARAVRQLRSICPVASGTFSDKCPPNAAKQTSAYGRTQ